MILSGLDQEEEMDFFKHGNEPFAFYKRQGLINIQLQILIIKSEMSAGINNYSLCGFYSVHVVDITNEN